MLSVFLIHMASLMSLPALSANFVRLSWQGHKGGHIDQEDQQHELRRGELPIEPQEFGNCCGGRPWRSESRKFSKSTDGTKHPNVWEVPLSMGGSRLLSRCWLRGTVVERRSLTGELSLYHARTVADG